VSFRRDATVDEDELEQRGLEFVSALRLRSG
jgi:hypothetical protein